MYDVDSLIDRIRELESVAFPAEPLTDKLECQFADDDTLYVECNDEDPTFVIVKTVGSCEECDERTETNIYLNKEQLEEFISALVYKHTQME